MGKKNVFKYFFILSSIAIFITIFSVLYGHFREIMLVFMIPLYAYTCIFIYNWRKNYKTIDEKAQMYKAGAIIMLNDLFLILGFIL